MVWARFTSRHISSPLLCLLLFMETARPLFGRRSAYGTSPIYIFHCYMGHHQHTYSIVIWDITNIHIPLSYGTLPIYIFHCHMGSHVSPGLTYKYICKVCCIASVCPNNAMAASARELYVHTGASACDCTQGPLCEHRAVT